MRESLPTEMRASVLHHAGKVVVEKRPVPIPAHDEVLVRVGSVGICGSDVHYFKEGRIGDFVVESPMVLGHEAGGVIVAVGTDIDSGRIGNRVSIEPQRPSPTSKQSLSGAYNLCPHMEFYATPPIDGAFAEFVTIQSHFAFDVPDTVSDDAAALMEPLSVGIAAARKAGVSAGSRVLVTGAGPIGIIAVQVARAFGATEIIVSDIDADRRAQALKFGADRALDAIADDAELRGLGVDVLLECSGATPAVRAGLEALAPAGTAVLVGMGADEIALPIPLIQNRELVVTGIFRYANTWPTAIDLVRTGRVDLDSLVTGTYGLEEVETGLLTSTASTSLKTMIHPGNGA